MHFGTLCEAGKKLDGDREMGEEGGSIFSERDSCILKIDGKGIGKCRSERRCWFGRSLIVGLEILMCEGRVVGGAGLEWN